MFQFDPMTYEQVVKHFGDYKKAAAALGFTPQGVHYWKRHGIKPHTQRTIELITRGKLKADDSLGH